MKKVRMEEEEGTKGKSGNMADVIGLTHSTDVIVTISAIYMCG
jgi:hypothetical protein